MFESTIISSAGPCRLHTWKRRKIRTLDVFRFSRRNNCGIIWRIPKHHPLLEVRSRGFQGILWRVFYFRDPNEVERLEAKLIIHSGLINLPLGTTGPALLHKYEDDFWNMLCYKFTGNDVTGQHVLVSNWGQIQSPWLGDKVDSDIDRVAHGNCAGVVSGVLDWTKVIVNSSKGSDTPCFSFVGLNKS